MGHRSKTAVLCAITAATLSTALEQKSSAEWKEYERIEMPREMHYFFRVFSSGRAITYNSHYKNYLMTFDWKDGKIASYQDIQIPGMLDPVPTPDDGRMITIPFIGGQEFPLLHKMLGGMRFYSTESMISEFQSRSHQNKKKIKTTEKLIRDVALPGSYQTIGLLGEDEEDGTRHYRVVTEAVHDKTSGFSIQEYAARPGKDGKIHLEKKWKDKQRVCQNIQFALPMLSKTGQYMGGADWRDPLNPKKRAKAKELNEPENTMIIQLPRNGSGDCEVVHELGRPTGKLDFSYDDRFVAFHAESQVDLPHLRTEKSIDSRPNTTRITRVRRLPSDDLHLNVFLYNMEATQQKDKFTKVTHCSAGSNCYYPGFMENGDLVYVERIKKTGKNYLVFLKNSDKGLSESASSWDISGNSSEGTSE
jgi:hypothetical protein